MNDFLCTVQSSLQRCFECVLLCFYYTVLLGFPPVRKFAVFLQNWHLTKCFFGTCFIFFCVFCAIATTKPLNVQKATSCANKTQQKRNPLYSHTTHCHTIKKALPHPALHMVAQGGERLITHYIMYTVTQLGETYISLVSGKSIIFLGHLVMQMPQPVHLV